MSHFVVTRCEHCNTTENLTRCDNCGTVFYCSEECKKNNWRYHQRKCDGTILEKENRAHYQAKYWRSKSINERLKEQLIVYDTSHKALLREIKKTAQMWLILQDQLKNAQCELAKYKQNEQSNENEIKMNCEQ